MVRAALFRGGTVKIKIEVKGVEETIAKLSTLNAKARKAVEQQIAESALNIQMGAKKRCPVRTGALRNSITVDFYGKMSAQIGPHMLYDKYVEFGTRKMAAQPYLFPAFEEERPKLEEGIIKAIKEASE